LNNPKSKTKTTTKGTIITLDLHFHHLLSEVFWVVTVAIVALANELKTVFSPFFTSSLLHFSTSNFEVWW